jgi:anti-sigma B factor antagonist
MNIEVIKNEETITFKLEGRLDTITSPNFERKVNEELVNIKTLILDLKNLKYISSSGLRVILTAQKKMNQLGKMKLINVNEMVMDVFEMTGFSNILTIE